MRQRKKWKESSQRPKRLSWKWQVCVRFLARLFFLLKKDRVLPTPKLRCDLKINFWKIIHFWGCRRPKKSEAICMWVRGSVDFVSSFWSWIFSTVCSRIPSQTFWGWQTTTQKCWRAGESWVVAHLPMQKHRKWNLFRFIQSPIRIEKQQVPPVGPQVKEKNERKMSFYQLWSLSMISVR